MSYTCALSLKKIKDYLAGAAMVGFDFETSPIEEYRSEERAALDAHKAAITGVSLSVSEDSGIYIPLRHRAGRNIQKPEAVMDYLRQAVFENATVIKVAHNLAFESMFLYALGVIVQPPCYDTIAAAQLTLKSSTTFRGLSDSGLKTLVPQLFHVELPDFETVTAGRFFDELDPQDQETVRYACADSDFALRLYHLFNGWFDQYLPRHRRIVERIESPTAVYCGLMRYNGLLMDRAAMEAKQAEAEERISAIREEIAFLIGDVEIGANASTSAFKSYLYKDLGLPVVKTTAKYQEAADDETMILLAAWCRENRPELTRLFELVQEYRRWGKIKGTYLDGYLRHINSATGRIHPDLMPLGTETGRFAARNPNMQNCPRKDNDPIGVRSMIVAPEGCVLLSLDFSQIELRVGAFYCRDEKMLQTYRNGGDIHAQTTSVIYHIPFEQAADKNAEHYKEGLDECLEHCLSMLDEAKGREGEGTKQDLSKLGSSFEGSLEFVEARADELEEHYSKLLQDKFSKLSGDKPDQAVFMTELAAILVRYSINEEVSRLKVHLKEYWKLLSSSEPVGKKLDFLCQEMQRECNTIASKSQLVEINLAVVNMKDNIEDIREQVRNIE